MSSAEEQIEQGERFAFGANWAAFLRHLDEDRIQIAEDSLRALLNAQTLAGRTFLDAGSGSGLFSLCARRMGARVHSFDFDAQAIACTLELKERFYPDDPDWTIESGSLLDDEFMGSLGQFDVVYSWGVLHHTGNMWRAMDLLWPVCRPGGQIAIAIYNFQRFRSPLWHLIKRIYCRNALGRWAMTALFYPWFFIRTCLVSIIRRHNEFARYRRHRGMSIVHDWKDWLGGLPYETASVLEIQLYFEARGFRLVQLRETRRLGCNEFVFVRES